MTDYVIQNLYVKDGFIIGIYTGTASFILVASRTPVLACKNLGVSLHHLKGNLHSVITSETLCPSPSPPITRKSQTEQ